MPGPIVEGFSLSHAAILDGTTGAETADIYGIREGSLEVDTDSYDNTGDDTILSTWTWFNYATLSIQSGYIPFDVISLLTGAPVTSSGAAPGDYYSISLWNEASLNQPTRPVLIRVPSKTDQGAVRTLDFVLYKVQFDPISLSGPTYKDGMALSYSGKALMSNKDEKGAVLTNRAIGRIVSRPAV